MATPAEAPAAGSGLCAKAKLLPPLVCALVGALLEENLEIIKLLVEAGSKLSEDYYEAASEMYGEEYTKPLRVAYGRTLN